MNTYAAGVAAIKSGQKVRWVGAGGLTNYNQYNNSQQGYIIVKYDAIGQRGHHRHPHSGADRSHHRGGRWLSAPIGRGRRR